MSETAIHFCCGGPNWVEIATLICLAFGGLFAWWQWRKACRVSRAEHLNEILTRYDMASTTNMFYRLINDTSYGGKDGEVFYLGGLRFAQLKDVAEKDLDSMLLLFSQICYERERRTISESEFDFFSYQVGRTLAHEQIKMYLRDFAAYCGRFGIGYPYLSLARYGLRVDADYYSQVCQCVESRHIARDFIERILP